MLDASKAPTFASTAPAPGKRISAASGSGLGPSKKAQETPDPAALLDQGWKPVELNNLIKKGYASRDTRNLGRPDSKANNKDSFEVIKFTNKDGVEIRVSPTIGANVLDLILDDEKIIGSPITRGEFKTGDEHKCSNYGGMPFISPPNRTRDNKIYNSKGEKCADFSDVMHQLRNVGGNMLHGMLYKLPWELEKSELNESSKALRLTFSYNTMTADNKTLREKLGDAKYTLTYTLQKDPQTKEPKLIVDIEVKNLSAKKEYPLVGFGLHPYFKVDPGDTFTVPANWVYSAKDDLPTGQLTHVEGGRLDLRRKTPVDYQGGSFDRWTGKKTPIDSDFTGLDAEKLSDTDFGLGPVVSRIFRRHGTLEIKQSPTMDHIVVCNNVPGTICIEPQTCSTNASDPSLKDKQGRKIGSPRYLAPGKSTRERVVINFKPNHISI